MRGDLCERRCADRINDTIGSALARFRRENSQATQQWVADRLGEALDTEYQVLTVRRMESGKRGFSAAEVVAVADLLGVTTDALLGHEQVADARAEAKAVSDFLHRQIRLLQGTRQLVQQAGLDGTPTAEVPFRSLEEVLGDGPEA